MSTPPVARRRCRDCEGVSRQAEVAVGDQGQAGLRKPRHGYLDVEGAAVWGTPAVGLLASAYSFLGMRPAR